jgi:hypothetical protein
MESYNHTDLFAVGMDSPFPAFGYGRLVNRYRVATKITFVSSPVAAFPV